MTDEEKEELRALVKLDYPAHELRFEPHPRRPDLDYAWVYHGSNGTLISKALVAGRSVGDIRAELATRQDAVVTVETAK